MQSFIHTVIIVVWWSGFCTSNEGTWSLRISDSSRDGRFLNVPIYYGDWVPITKAKQTIEAVASKIEAATKPVRRKDPPLEIITADQPEDRLDTIVPYEPSHQHHQTQALRPSNAWSQGPQGVRPQHHQQRWKQHQPQQWRRNDNFRNNNNRGHRKLPPPGPFVNQFSSLFQQVTTPKPEEITTSASSSGFNLGSVFNFLNPLIQHKPDIILHDSPVIKTLPAPDLTKVISSVNDQSGLFIIRMSAFSLDHLLLNWEEAMLKEARTCMLNN